MRGFSNTAMFWGFFSVEFLALAEGAVSSGWESSGFLVFFFPGELGFCGGDFRIEFVLPLAVEGGASPSSRVVSAPSFLNTIPFCWRVFSSYGHFFPFEFRKALSLCAQSQVLVVPFDVERSDRRSSGEVRTGWFFLKLWNSPLVFFSP